MCGKFSLLTVVCHSYTRLVSWRNDAHDVHYFFGRPGNPFLCHCQPFRADGAPKISINLSKSNVDLFQIYQFLNNKISWARMQGRPDYIDPTPPKMDKKQTKIGNMIDWLGDNAKQVSAADIEQKFKTEFPILLDDEKVEIVSPVRVLFCF
jgi:hypothetical protein